MAEEDGEFEEDKQSANHKEGLRSGTQKPLDLSDDLLWHVNDEDIDEFELAYQERLAKTSLLGHLGPGQALQAWRPVVVLFSFCVLASLWYWYQKSIFQGFSSDLLTSERSQIFAEHQYWRLFTSMAVHSDLAHLASNSVLFFIFGWILRAYIGPLAFPYLSLLAGVLTQAITLFTYSNGVRLVGASGAIYAMVGIWLTYYLLIEDKQRWSQKTLRTLGFILVLLMPTSIQTQVSYRAHAIGFGVGCLLALITKNSVKRRLRARASKLSSYF